MTGSSHSPGTFEIAEFEDGTIAITSSLRPDAIAELPYSGRHFEAEQRANASLFQAAPKLLHACKAALSVAAYMGWSLGDAGLLLIDAVACASRHNGRTPRQSLSRGAAAREPAAPPT